MKKKIKFINILNSKKHTENLIWQKRQVHKNHPRDIGVGRGPY